MSSIEKRRAAGCPIAYGLDIFGDRWTLLIIRDMMMKGFRTYGEFLDAGEGVSTNILADRLKHLEAEGVIEKSRDPENRRSFLYSLTKKGRDLAPILLEIAIWSGAHDASQLASREVLERIERDREGYESSLRAKGAPKRK